MAKTYTDQYITCNIQLSRCNKYVNLNGKINSPENYSVMELIAPNPVIKMTSYSGTGLPYSCIDHALEGTKNKMYPTKDGIFSGVFTYPNSYYTADMKIEVKPSIFVQLVGLHESIKTIVLRIELPDPYPLRTLVHRPGFYKGPSYCHDKEYMLPITTAEKTMLYMSGAKIKYDITQ